MKLTKKMEALIDKRTALAIKLMEVGSQIDDFIMKNGLENEVEDCDWLTGVEIYGSPWASGRRIKEAILKHKK